MSLYDRAAATALRMLKSYGQPVTLRVYSAAAYDPTAGAVKTAFTDTTRQAAIFDFKRINNGQSLETGTLVQQGDKQCLMDASGPAPRLNDHVIVGGNEYVIRDIKAINPAGTPVLYELLIRT